ncbi:MAG: GNAT family N-acetyltransferase [Thermosynechococcaceae cyanobacterium MS004]|nr:GNAT family N-acetyltransferase [Thermosynechococcaceae cyanobacterium MS004]
MQIRLAQRSDAPRLRQLFYDTVHQVNIQDYSLAQVNAWAPALSDPQSWQPKFAHQWTLIAEEVAEDIAEEVVAEETFQILGFCELQQDGHIGCFYCHAQHQRQGVGSFLLRHLEAIALQQGLCCLYTEASITAKPFFEHWGFRVMQVQDVERRGVLLRNFVMEKALTLGKELAVDKGLENN